MKELLSIALVAVMVFAASSCKNANKAAEEEAAAVEAAAQVTEGAEAACEAINAEISDAESAGIIQGLESISSDAFADAVSYALVEVKPAFQGGDANSFQKWIQENISYPQAAIDNNEEGKVMVQFVVNKLGQIQNASVVKGVSEALDAEALRAVQSAPVWTPGSQAGQPVSVAYVLPVVFALK